MSLRSLLITEATSSGEQDRVDRAGASVDCSSEEDGNKGGGLEEKQEEK